MLKCHWNWFHKDKWHQTEYQLVSNELQLYKDFDHFLNLHNAFVNILCLVLHSQLQLSSYRIICKESFLRSKLFWLSTRLPNRCSIFGWEKDNFWSLSVHKGWSSSSFRNKSWNISRSVSSHKGQMTNSNLSEQFFSRKKEWICGSCFSHLKKS